MKHVIGLDVSKGKSTVTIYDSYRQCKYEGEINHVNEHTISAHHFQINPAYHLK
jgi:hypothetical protein